MSKESERALREVTEHLRAARVARFRGTLINHRHADEQVHRAIEHRHDAGMRRLAATEGLYLSVKCETCGAEIDEACRYDTDFTSQFSPTHRSPGNPHEARRKASGEEEISAEVEEAMKEAARD